MHEVKRGGPAGSVVAPAHHVGDQGGRQAHGEQGSIAHLPPQVGGDVRVVGEQHVPGTDPTSVGVAGVDGVDDAAE